MRILAVLLATAIVGAVATTVSPSQHNFGKWAIGQDSPEFTFRVTLPAGSALTDSIDVSLVGPDAADFDIYNHPNALAIRGVCATGQLTGTLIPGACDIGVQFSPSSIGQKTARLQIVDRAGTITAARLTGEGVTPLCITTAVWCNYAHHYTGSFDWTVSLRGPYGSDIISLQVTVQAGVAFCTGSHLKDGPSGPWRGSITGPGIIGVEFVQDPIYPFAYEITVACPSAMFPPAPDGSPGLPSAPAELGSSYSITTYKQAAMAVGKDLTGGESYPAPESDPVNGVTGGVGITRSLLRRPPSPPPPPPPPPPPAR